ncbi:hypothetical protein [Amycolatopsis sp. DSM 110486]|uniref:hypothetical protein n=1 Tax=Amycolatopsis sp. DSM 110486 TaxID=2865832 RepID=UPI001C694311|nr:hypothetical protein [Amycolatopsis sp. DSM 110486]QYN19170.1 hypothetical protein K1T34_42030 [Amycolatopsis sp. DSM 110486]
MLLEILHVPDCPNVALLEQCLTEVLAGHAVPTEWPYRVVEDVEMARAVGMTGSPTVLIDGVDPFAEPGLEPSVSCRVVPRRRRPDAGCALGRRVASGTARLTPVGSVNALPGAVDANS